MTAPPPSDWLEQGQNAVWFFGIAFMGFMVWIFGKPIQHTKPARRSQGRKRTVKQSNSPKKQVARKHRTTQKRKQKPKPQYTAPPLSREQEAKIDRYRAKRDGVKFDDSWSSFGIPL